MIYFAESLGQLRNAVNSYIKLLGEDCPIIAANDNIIQLEYVFVNSKLEIVGDEAGNYKPKDGEFKALLIK